MDREEFQELKNHLDKGSIVKKLLSQHFKVFVSTNKLEDQNDNWELMKITSVMRHYQLITEDSVSQLLSVLQSLDLGKLLNNSRWFSPFVVARVMLGREIELALGEASPTDTIISTLKAWSVNSRSSKVLWNSMTGNFLILSRAHMDEAVSSLIKLLNPDILDTLPISQDAFLDCFKFLGTDEFKHFETDDQSACLVSRLTYCKSSPKLSETLLLMLDHSGDSVKLETIKSACQVEGAPVEELLRKMATILDKVQPDYQAQLVLACRFEGSEVWMETMLSLLNHSNEKVRAAAGQMISEQALG